MEKYELKLAEAYGIVQTSACPELDGYGVVGHLMGGC